MANDMLFTCVDQEHLHTQQSGLVNVPGSWQVKHQMTTTLFCCHHKRGWWLILDCPRVMNWLFLGHSVFGLIYFSCHLALSRFYLFLSWFCYHVLIKAWPNLHLDVVVCVQTYIPLLYVWRAST